MPKVFIVDRGSLRPEMVMKEKVLAEGRLRWGKFCPPKIDLETGKSTIGEPSVEFKEMLDRRLREPSVREILEIGMNIDFAQCCWEPASEEIDFYCDLQTNDHLWLESLSDDDENVRIAIPRTSRFGFRYYKEKELLNMGFKSYGNEFHKKVKVEDLKAELLDYYTETDRRMEEGGIVRTRRGGRLTIIPPFRDRIKQVKNYLEKLSI